MLFGGLYPQNPLASPKSTSPEPIGSGDFSYFTKNDKIRKYLKYN